MVHQNFMVVIKMSLCNFINAYYNGVLDFFTLKFVTALILHPRKGIFRWERRRSHIELERFTISAYLLCFYGLQAPSPSVPHLCHLFITYILASRDFCHLVKLTCPKTNSRRRDSRNLGH